MTAIPAPFDLYAFGSTSTNCFFISSDFAHLEYPPLSFFRVENPKPDSLSKIYDLTEAKTPIRPAANTTIVDPKYLLVKALNGLSPHNTPSVAIYDIFNTAIQLKYNRNTQNIPNIAKSLGSAVILD